MAIIELDQGISRRTPPKHDRGAFAALVVACSAFALAVWIARPAAMPATRPDAMPVAPPVASTVADTTVSSVTVPRGAVLHPLRLPQSYINVDLGAMPDRLANEAAPWTLRGVITVRGMPGVASIEGPSVITWTENGIAYWLASPTGTTDDLIQIANELR